MEKIQAFSIGRRNRGFSLLELMVAVMIIFILGALAMPRIANEVSTVRVKYSATDLSGVLQRARMEAVRKNSFYSVQYVGGNPSEEQVVDRTGAPVTSIPPSILGNTVTVTYGTGSGAPGEAAFITARFPAPQTVAAAATGLPSFNARGLPCVPASITVCNLVLGQGFVFFLSGKSPTGGGVNWSAVAVTPSGRCEVWTYDGFNWTQQ